MRLVCPNCGAQYEIDDRVIPDAGRDVQCSSCGHAWYQMPASGEVAEDAAPVDPTDLTEADEAIGTGAEAEDSDTDDTLDEDALRAADPAPEPEPEAEPEPEPAPVAVVSAPDEDADDEDDEPLVDAGTEGATPPRRELDDSLRAILQEERAREMAARAADGGADLLAGTEATAVAEAVAATEAAETEAEPAADTASEPEVSKKDQDGGYAAFGPIPGDDDLEDDIFAPSGAGGAVTAATAAAADQSSRGRDLFPDIEEINSTLDSHGTDEDYVEEPEQESRSGFGRAFFAIIFLAALAFALYLVAPKLAQSVPALEPALAGYVDAVNGARAGLEGLLQGVTDQIDGASE